MTASIKPAFQFALSSHWSSHAGAYCGGQLEWTLLDHTTTRRDANAKNEVSESRATPARPSAITHSVTKSRNLRPSRHLGMDFPFQPHRDDDDDDIQQLRRRVRPLRLRALRIHYSQKREENEWRKTRQKYEIRAHYPAEAAAAMLM